VGGLGSHVAELVPALARAGVEVHVVTPRYGPSPEHEVVEGVTLHRALVSPATLPFPDFHARAWHTNLALQRVCERVVERDGPFDLVHTHDWLTFFAARELKHAHKLPLVATIHATERGRGRGGLLGEVAQRIDRTEWELAYEAWRVICCARYMAAEVHSFFGAPAEKIDVIPNGVDARPYQALEGHDLSVVRERYALPGEKIVLHVGRIVAEKGSEVLLRAMPGVLAQVPEAKCVIVGRGPELERLRGLVVQMNLGRKVALPGFISVEERNSLYKLADCAVFPSLYEPFGIVALEAMAARVPVVVSEVGGLQEVVRHGETGITVYPNDPASCAWGIIHTLQHPDWAKQRVENAYQEALTTFNWDNIAARTAAVYQRVVAERQRAAW
jgi:glycogen(starch) synthase